MKTGQRWARRRAIAGQMGVGGGRPARFSHAGRVASVDSGLGLPSWVLQPVETS